MRRVLAATIVAVLVLAGCSTPTEPGTTRGSIADIEIGVSDTKAPSITVDPTLVFNRNQSRVEWNGTGPQLVDGEALLLDIYGVRLDTGEIVINTYDGLPRSFIVAPEILGDALYDQLSELRVGARLVHVATADPALDGAAVAGPVAFVIDILPSRAQGEPVGATATLPIVVLGADGTPMVSIREGDAVPTELITATTIRGGGEQIDEHSHVLANYVLVRWRDGLLIDSSWPITRAPLVADMDATPLPEGFVQGLLGKTGGSQVVIVVPPRLGYPDDGVVVFVVDILDVWNPES